MPSYTIPYAKTPDWSTVPEMELRHCGWTPMSGITAKAQLCYDEEALHVRMEAVESAIRATFTGKLDPVCQDSCLEFFFAPRAEDKRYFNLEWNFLGALNLGFGAERANRDRQIPKKPEELFKAQPFRTEEGWGITFDLPLRLLQVYFPDYRFEGEAAANFYKCGDVTPLPHFLAWSFIHSETPDFHRRGDFGQLVFGPKA